MKALKYIMAALMALAVTGAGAQRLNDKTLNRPYADMRAWHLGFSVGVHTQDMQLSHSGYVTEDGQTWFMEQPSFQPGFCVNGLVDFRLNDYFNVRVTPGMYFGNRIIKMIDTTGAGGTEQQNIKSAYLVLPVDLKYSAMRYHNVRPYVVGGVMPTYDVTRKRADFIKTKPFDMMLSVGFGCDIYLPYFKLSPEIKFCFGLTDIIVHDRPDLVDDPVKLKITESIRRATSQMVVLTFYFE